METELVVLWYKIFQIIIICSITNCSASYHDKRRGMITKKCASVQIICWSDFHSIWFGNISRGTVGFAASVSVYPGQVVYFLFSCSQHDVSPLQCLQLVIKNRPCCMSVKINGHLSGVTLCISRWILLSVASIQGRQKYRVFFRRALSSTLLRHEEFCSIYEVRVVFWP